MPTLNILLSSAGRRVELMECLREALVEVGVNGQVMVSDASPLTAAGWMANGLELVPRVDNPAYTEKLLDIVERHDIGLVVPTIDTELAVLSSLAEELESVGAGVLRSGVETIEITAHKSRTHEFLAETGLPRPRQWSAADARRAAEDLPYPVIAKPDRGSSSIGVAVVDGPRELMASLESEGYVVETLAPGQEYTVDVWVDRSGRVRSAVPRQRLEVRAGEVSKGVTRRHQPVIDLATQVAEGLPDAYGPLTIQIFADDSSAEVIEVNPRFGGGYPLSWAAGARTAVWALQDALDWPLAPDEFDWADDLVMLRYDQSVFVSGHRLRR